MDRVFFLRRLLIDLFDNVVLIHKLLRLVQGQFVLRTSFFVTHLAPHKFVLAYLVKGRGHGESEAARIGAVHIQDSG